MTKQKLKKSGALILAGIAAFLAGTQVDLGSTIASLLAIWL